MASSRSRLRKMLVGVAGTGSALYAGVCGLMFALQDRLVYFPSAEITRTPEDVGLGFEHVALRTPDGESIAAWFVPAAQSRGVVLYSHGNGGNLSNRVSVVEDLHALGLDVLIYDYHGFGESTGSPGEAQTYLDARAAWDWLVRDRRIPPDRIVIWGRSLGGAVAVWLASEVREARPAGLVIESSFTSLPDVGATYYPYLPVHALTRHEYPSLGRIQTVEGPILVAHGPSDRVVPYILGRELFAAAPEPKQFIELTGGHNDAGLASDAYRAPLEGFLASALDPR